MTGRFRLYKYDDNNLVSVASWKHNIAGWYTDETIAIADLQRISNLFPGQFILIEFDLKRIKYFSEQGSLVRI